MVEREDITRRVDNIIGEDNDLTFNVKLEDLIWTIVVFQYRLKEYDDEIDKAYNGRIYANLRSLITDKECIASRCDEIARIIGQYSTFDTSRIWEETRKIHQ